MTRTRAWRRWQRERIRRRRAHYFSVRWAHELGDGRLIDMATEHPQKCSCDLCANHYPVGKSPVELRAPAVPTPPRGPALFEEADSGELPGGEAAVDEGDEEDDSPGEAMLPRVVYGREVVSVDVVYVEPRFSWSGKDGDDRT